MNPKFADPMEVEIEEVVYEIEEEVPIVEFEIGLLELGLILLIVLIVMNGLKDNKI